MAHHFWNDWYLGWGWFLWFAVLLLLFSSTANWRYTYQAHRRYGHRLPKEAMDILNERYATGEITRDEFMTIKADIAKSEQE